MSNFWMVRAGEGGYLVEDFEQSGCAAIGWQGTGDLSGIPSLDAMRERVRRVFPDMKPVVVTISASVLFKFAHIMQPGDRIVTYDPQRREYVLGTVVSAYRFDPGALPDYNHVRDVQWEARVSRDDLSVTARNTLGAAITLFEPGEAVLREMEAAARGERPLPTVEAEVEETDGGLEAIRRDQIERAHEFIKDRIRALSPEDLEALAAAILRAMGFKARVTPKGPDRGRDVIASPDGLGLQQPRIRAEVKHRPGQTMGAPEIRGFIGGLRSGDSGLYLSTGGFTREAHYEAERASIPVTLIDLDDLASLVVEHYEQFDSEGRSLVPLLRVYWPAS
ncbi:MAG TPA: restriction endonuclease [Rubricoccaceae bacterium]|jgi:restriction system protein|nr:restriction endonuclease [Rubricoccaceae bacterium]